MRFLSVLILGIILSWAGYAQETPERFQGKVNVELVIPSPMEMFIRGQSLQVIPEVAEYDVLQYKFSKAKKEQGAIYLGRMMSIMLVGLDMMDDPTLVMFFLAVKQGMQTLQVDQNYIDLFESLRKRYEDKTLSRFDMVDQVELAYAKMIAVANIKGSSPVIYQILQASAWVQGQNLLARAMKTYRNYKSAKTLLYHPSVIQLILEHLNQAKAKGTPPEIADPLIDSLRKYQKATEAQMVGADEVQIVIEETNKFLQKF